jgi:glycosyltransferase involved in cell wall biosynthesis
MFNSNKLTDFKNYKQLFEFKKHIIAGKFDMLHFVGNNHWVIMLNYLFRNEPHIHTLHEPYPFVKQSRYRLIRHRFKINLLIRSNITITVPSQVSFDRFNEKFKLPDGFLRLIPFGPFEIFKMYLKKQVDKQPDMLLYYGYISKYKGIEVLVEAMRKVTTDTPRFKLVIAGNGTFGHDLSSLNAKVELINRYLTNEEIAVYNQMANVVVCPYIGASQSGVVMTSFAFDNPVIATDVGALPEVIETGVTGLIVKPNDADALYKAICDLFRDPATIDTMRTNVNAKYSDSESSWTGITQQTYRLYERELKRRKSA